MGEVANVLRILLENSVGLVEYDSEWMSPCVVLPPDANNMVIWRPVEMKPAPDFMDIPLRPEIAEFYTSFWGKGWEGSHSDEAVMLCVPWNADELAAIKESLTLNAAAGVPIFIANTGSDLYFGVDNSSGTVWLCEPGYPPTRQVASSLEAFLASLE